MSEIKHTSGPWYINPEDDFEVINAEWGCVAMIPNEPAENEPLMKQAKANARLIAAAPDLLEACKEVLALIDDPDISESKKLWKLGPNFSLARKIEKAIQNAETKNA